MTGALRSLLLSLLLVAGCSGPSIFDVTSEPGEGACAEPDALAYGRDPLSGACVMFASRCDVPAEWTACTPFVACMDDSTCPAAQHCADVPPPREAGAPERACVANDPCAASVDCGDANQICVADAAGAGTCTRTDPANPPPAPPPTAPTCPATSECAALELCPAQYGGCSPGNPDDANPVDCPSHCEKACLADSDCADPTTLRCNAADVCATSTNDAMGNPGLACAGWCVRRM